MNPRGLLLAAALLLAALPAQAPAGAEAPAADDFTRLHAAWVKEMLDLDVQGAVADYQQIAGDRRPGNLERWIAITRLAELARIGVSTGPRGPLDEAPAQVRAALALLTPLPVPDLLLQAPAAPTGGAPLLGEATRTVDLRPAMPIVQNWVRRLVGPSMSARSQQRFQALNARTRPDSRATEAARLERDAHEVLRSELEGNLEQAASRRELLFRDWRPPEAKGDPAVLVARALANLDAWRADPDLPEVRKARLTALRDELQARAATNTTAALDLLLRLPYLAERLLAEPTPR